jgi:hypothetical protein
MGQNAEWCKTSTGKNIKWKKRRMVQNVQWKNTEWDKTSNEKTSDSTKRQIENRKEKYINIFGFLLLLSDYIGTITY